MATEETSGGAARGVAYLSPDIDRQHFAVMAPTRMTADTKREVAEMTFAQVLERRNDQLDAIELARQSFDQVLGQKDMHVERNDYQLAKGARDGTLDGLRDFERAVEASPHADNYRAYVKNEDRELAKLLVERQLATVTEQERRPDGRESWAYDTGPANWTKAVGNHSREDAMAELGADVRLSATVTTRPAPTSDFRESIEAAERAFEENRRDVYREAMSEMAEQLDRRDTVTAAALYETEQRQRSIDPNSEATQDAIRNRKATEFADMAAEQGMTPAQLAESLSRDNFATDLATARQLNDLDRDGVPDHLEHEVYTGAEEMANAAYEQLMRDHAEHQVAPEDAEWTRAIPVEHRGLAESSDDLRAAAMTPGINNSDGEPKWLLQAWDDDKGEYVSFSATDSAADAQIEFEQDQRYRVVDIERSEVAVRHDVHSGEIEVNPNSTFQLDYMHESQAAETRWSVQAKDAEKGVFVDVLATDSALEADEAFRAREREDARVIDNRINDYAAQWERVHPSAAPELDYHSRSDFSDVVKTELRAGLQAAIDRRAELQAKVDQATESVSVAVDQVRDNTAPIDKVQQGYAEAAMAYAGAKRELEAFEARPSESETVTLRFRELQENENRVEKAREAAAHSRIDGATAEQAQDAQHALASSQEFLKAFASREGVRLPPATDKTSNEIEAGLTPEQIKRLMEAPRKEQAAAVLDREADKAAAASRPSIGTAHNEARDQSAFADAAARDKLVPEDVAAAYRREGQKYLDLNDPKKVAFVDKGNRLQTVRTFDDKAVSDMIQTADARGWSEIKVTGDEAFRRKAWIEATARGIEVKGYEPTEKDKVRAEQLGRQTGHANAIEENPTAKAYRDARDLSPKERTAAARQNPELVAAFALEAAARSFAKQRLAPEAREGFVDRTREMIERDLAQGKPIPEVRRRQEAERKQDAVLER